MKILRVPGESGSIHICFNEGDRYYILNADAHDLDAQDILSAHGNYRNLNLTEIDAPEYFAVPLPFERIFLPAVNFRAHGAESDITPPEEPYFFLKFKSSLVAHGCKVFLPPNVKKADYEGEIGIVIGKRGKYIRKEDAMDHVFGYTIVDDVSLRDYQFREQPRFGKNWVMGKQFDNALPTGPCVVPKEDARNSEFTIQTRINGELRQNGSTEDMIFSIPELISYLSEVNTLMPGDLITTGTPAGVGAFSEGRYLGDGDKVEITVSEVGTLMHYVSFR